MVCFLVIAKMSLRLLRVVAGKLLTRSFLKELGIMQADQCVLCKASTEILAHLFFECPFTSYLWQLYRLKLGITVQSMGLIQDEATLLQNKFKKKKKPTILSRMILAAAVWHIWRERNVRVLQQQESHKIVVFKNLSEDIRILMTTCHWKTYQNASMKDVLANWNV